MSNLRVRKFGNELIIIIIIVLIIILQLVHDGTHALSTNWYLFAVVSYLIYYYFF